MEPFKNEFSFQRAQSFIAEIQRVYPDLDEKAFLDGLKSELEPLELKQCMQLWADRLEALLPGDPVVMFRILVAALRPDEDAEEGLASFQVWPLTELVARHGLRCFDPAMEALREMTQRFTAEFAVRPFLREETERSLAQFERWTSDPNHHVRRLVSEGSRPFLPWGERLPRFIEEPQLTLSLLERLKADASDYVRLSVANHLNDFSKVHPDLVVKTLKAWRRAYPDKLRYERLARHACRTLVKQGHSGALELLGYAGPEAWELLSLELGQKQLRMGEALSYSLRLRNRTRRTQKLLFDFAIGLRKANGRLSPKVFKGRVREVAAGETIEISGKHIFKPVTTRVYYPGTHTFELRLNGKAFEPIEFELLES
ncbi:MAG: DNA alkylation repair protein [Opitutales bacterium]|nr:DNA alkylation repair protein [Opitutales bacterium]